jgi:hypothetical protein
VHEGTALFPSAQQSFALVHCTPSAAQQLWPTQPSPLQQSLFSWQYPFASKQHAPAAHFIG